ncbi:hypothetical protein DPMN_091692 [Dreissena polymorpha]|uniref:Uncharacterized protein n=1 Tax=Dreissena polymorpha TaxID=45954 RepID=A0A9D4KZZ9_DREPO|nr:hypothetical protein DPMN_091692 [Dreissena polymorpha]
MKEVFNSSGFNYELPDTNATSVNSTGIILDVSDSTKVKSGTIDYWSYGLISFTSTNIYLLIFVSISISIFIITSIIRHRHQRNKDQQKETEYLRYFYSVMPHSQIYGNLSKLFENEEKSIPNKTRNRMLMERQQQSFASRIMHAMYKRYPYNPYVVREMEDEEMDEVEMETVFEEMDEVEMETVFELDDELAKTRSNSELQVPERKKTVQWCKYSFQNMSTPI